MRFDNSSRSALLPLTGHHMDTGLSPQHIDRLSACVVSKSVKRGANIFVKGDPGTSLFVIGAGKVKISIPSVQGKDAIFNLLGEGDVFGEIALLDGHRRTADATAVTNCDLYVIERKDFLPVMREEPEITLRLFEILCSRLRRTTEQAQGVMSLDLPSRLAKALMRLLDADTIGEREHKISITQKDLGNIIGMSRESTNKQLRLWEEKKWVRLERNAVVILETAPLTAIAKKGSPTPDGPRTLHLG